MERCGRIRICMCIFIVYLSPVNFSLFQNVDNTFPSVKNHVLSSDSKGSTLTFTWSNITFGLYDAPTFPTIVKISVFLPKGLISSKFHFVVLI